MAGNRISSSWNVEQVEIAAEVASVLLRGGDVRMLVRQPAFARFARSVGRLAYRASKLPKHTPFVGHRETVREALRAHGVPMKTAQIAVLTGLRLKTVNWALREERAAGHVERVGWALYTVAKPRVTPIRLVKRELPARAL